MSARRNEAADARRYRWLRENSIAYEYPTNAPAVFMCGNDCKPEGQPIDGKQLDRQVDLAMEAYPSPFQDSPEKKT
jgi:hypothetical protein